MYLSAIVLAAGRGVRFNSKIPKPLAHIKSKPIIIYPLETLSKHPSVRDIVLVVNAVNSESIIGKIRQYRISKIKSVIKGGRRRQDSVYKGLKAMNERTDLVLIHDGVRPFINRKLISSLITEAKRNGAAITGVPVKATIKKLKAQSSKLKGELVVEKTLERNNLWEVQTPQVFKKDLIMEAYKRFSDIDATDDAMLVEKLGAKVSMVLGSYKNIKITTPEDLVIAKAIAKEWNTK